jgi:hypothetical protein
MTDQDRLTLDEMKKSDIMFARNRDRVSTDLDGETVILDISSGTYSSLNEVGSTIWNILEKPATFFAIVEGVMAEYDVDQEQCEHDLAVFLNDMLGYGLIAMKHDGDS